MRLTLTMSRNLHTPTWCGLINIINGRYAAHANMFHNLPTGIWTYDLSVGFTPSLPLSYGDWWIFIEIFTYLQKISQPIVYSRGRVGIFLLWSALVSNNKINSSIKCNCCLSNLTKLNLLGILHWEVWYQIKFLRVYFNPSARFNVRKGRFIHILLLERILNCCVSWVRDYKVIFKIFTIYYNQAIIAWYFIRKCFAFLSGSNLSHNLS